MYRKSCSLIHLINEFPTSKFSGVVLLGETLKMRRFCWWRRRLFALNRVDDDDNGCGIRGVASPLPPPSSSSLPLTILSLPIKSQATPSPTPYRATVSARYDGATNEGTLSAATAAAWKWRRRAVGLAALAIFELLLLLFLLAILLVYRRRSLSEGYSLNNGAGGN